MRKWHLHRRNAGRLCLVISIFNMMKTQGCDKIEKFDEIRIFSLRHNHTQLFAVKMFSVFAKASIKTDFKFKTLNIEDCTCQRLFGKAAGKKNSVKCPCPWCNSDANAYRFFMRRSDIHNVRKIHKHLLKNHFSFSPNLIMKRHRSSIFARCLPFPIDEANTKLAIY